MGRSRGRLSSKIHAVVDSNGLPMRLALTAGEAHDNRLAGKLLSRLKGGAMLLADRGYGFSDIRKVVSWRNELVTRTEKGEDGEPVMVLMPRVTIVDADKISDEAAAAVAEVSQTVNGALRVKLHDKHAALVSIGKHLGMFVDRVQIQERKQISAEPMSAEEWKRQYVRAG